MTHYFKTDYGIDERFLGILEDSIYFNPLLTRNDKDALVTSLYSLFYESKKNKQVYTLHKLEKPYKVPLVEETDVISIAELRQAIADYMQSEGCSCCQDIEGHEAHRERLAKLLRVPPHPEQDDFFDFSPYRSED